MTVKEFIKKWNIKESRLRIYVTSKDDEEYRDLYRFYDEEVINCYDHNGDVVLQIA